MIVLLIGQTECKTIMVPQEFAAKYFKPRLIVAIGYRKLLGRFAGSKVGLNKV